MTEETKDLAGKAAIAAGAAIGSAAIAAALLFVKRRKARSNEKALHPEKATETD
ncbi:MULTISPECIES: hypothetical protein [Sphingomonadaceae]|uniref:hypothetical protein n=1 Tax=Sphingomonadaceae TaxID=41297 RepID=UPI00163B8FF5|nr:MULTISPECIES: hypothetical protein [Sphingomonadaceae]